jgi:hypothetical protein
VKSAVVISAGFRERGAEGVELERQIQEQLRRGSMRLIGPNCLGVMNPSACLNATFAKDAPRLIVDNNEEESRTLGVMATIRVPRGAGSKRSSS